MHSQRKTFNSPSEISIVSRQSSFSFSFFTQSLNHFHLSRQVSRTKSRRSILWSVKHFHAKKEEKREKCKSLRCFVLRTFFFFLCEVKVMFCLEALEKWGEIFCVWLHPQFSRLMKVVNAKSYVFFAIGPKQKQTHYFISGREMQ